MAQTQKALVLIQKNGPQEIQDWPIPTPKENEVLIKIQSAALNPVDYKIIDYGVFIQNYPTILGSDGAGIIEAVGKNVTKHKVGDRVLFQGEYGNASRCTFQQYATIPDNFAVTFPDSLTFDQAASIPLAAITAGRSLYGGFNLPFPWEKPAANKDQYILVWGGATSVGQLTVQLANLSGFKVIATASPHNHKHLQSLGAAHVLNYHDKDIVDQIKAIAGDDLVYAIDNVGAASAQLCWEALSSTKPSNLAMIIGEITPKDDSKKVALHKVFGSSYVFPDFAVKFWEGIQKLVAEGKVLPNNVEVLKGGLAGVGHGQNLQREGKVSNVKLIVHPQESA